MDNGSIQGSILFRNNFYTVAGLEGRNKFEHYPLTNYSLSTIQLSTVKTPGFREKKHKFEIFNSL